MIAPGCGFEAKSPLRHLGHAVGAGLDADLEHEGSKQVMKAPIVSETTAVSEQSLCMREVMAMRAG